jgi:hypothetical protein
MKEVLLRTTRESKPQTLSIHFGLLSEMNAALFLPMAGTNGTEKKGAASLTISLDVTAIAFSLLACGQARASARLQLQPMAS